MHGYGFALHPAAGGTLGGAPPPYRPRAPYAPPGEQGAPPPPYAGPAAPQRPQTPHEQARDAMSTIRNVIHMAEEMRSMFPGQGGDDTTSAPQAAEDDDSPIRIIEAGGRKLLLNKEDGGLRIAETLFANMDGIFKFMGEQHEVFQKNLEKRRAAQQQQPRRQLPPGYVEVGPGYKPPDGFVVVPVEPQHDAPSSEQEHLPPPQENLPPPVGEPKPTWGMPTIPEGEG